MKTKVLKPSLLFIVILLALVTTWPLPKAESAGEAGGSDGDNIPTFHGPLHIRNAHPLMMAAGTPELQGAAPRDSFDMVITYASTFLVDGSPEWSFGVDVETLVVELKGARKLAGSYEVSLSVPFLSNNAGFLDGLLDWYHTSTGFGDYGRSTRPHNAFLYEVSKAGSPVIEGRNGRLRLGDITLGVKKALVTADPVVSVYGYVELPTGDADHGFGTGDTDGGAGVLVNKSLTPRLMAYLNAGYVFTGKLRAVMDERLRDYLYGGAGIEWAWREKLGLNGQVFVQGSPLRDTGVDGVDNISVILSFGGRYKLGRGSLEFSFSEDPSVAGAPDFMAALGYGIEF